ncbi:hypothetical protein [Hippea maritima]|nr:hypothetical protein [Hippea maritima]
MVNCPDRDAAFSYFSDFLANSTAKSTIFELIMSFKVVGEILFGIFCQSNTLSVFLINNPEYIFWLIENDTLALKKSKEIYLAEAKEFILSATTIDRMEYLLRHYRKREYLRIATREIVNACSFEEIMEELSNLADALAEIAIILAYKKLKKNYKKDGFCIMGLGKLGNKELNFSSDIDLLFVHNGDAEFFNRLASLVVSILNQNKEGGFVYRVDVRLRPGGNAYPLSMSVDEYETYYETFGQPWERLALVKVRPIAGDFALGERFLKAIEPFVYKKSIDVEYIEEIRRLLFKIKKYSPKKEIHLVDPKKQDIKKGEGGIREIEFIVNYFQLIYAGKIKELRHISTVDGLAMLGSLGLLENVEFLKEAYIFLRRIEHKIQLLEEQQKQTLPSSREGLEKLALKLGYKLDEFLDKYNEITDRVHILFRKIFIEDKSLPVLSSPEDIEAYLYEFGFSLSEAERVSNIIVSAVKKFLASDIKPFTINELFYEAFNLSKDIKRFENVVVGFDKINPSYTASIFSNRSLFKLFVKLLSIDYADKFVSNPFLLDVLLAPSELKIEDVSKKEKERLEFEIALRILSGSFKHSDFGVVSELARRFIKQVVEVYDDNHSLCVIAYGKLATDELFVGSDLDLVFASKEDAWQQEGKVVKIIKELKKLYDVDLRLRPFGDKGSLVVDVDYLKRYFSKDAQEWEKQAAQKSRIVYCGFEKGIVEEIYREFVLKNPPDKKSIYEMFNRIEKNKGSGVDLKSSWGGLTNIEFLTQAICFENECIELGMNTPQLIDKITRLGFFDLKEVKEIYFYLFKVLNTLRLAGFSSKLDENNAKIIEFLLDESNVIGKVRSFMNIIKQKSQEYFK